MIQPSNYYMKAAHKPNTKTIYRWSICTLGHWDHRHIAHTIWKTIHGLPNTAPPLTLNTSITFNNKITTTPKTIGNCFTKQLINTVRHATHKTNRLIDRTIQKIQGYNLSLITTQIQEAIKESKNNNSLGPGKLNIRYLNPLELVSSLSRVKGVGIKQRSWMLVEQYALDWRVPLRVLALGFNSHLNTRTKPLQRIRAFTLTSLDKQTRHPWLPIRQS